MLRCHPVQVKEEKQAKKAKLASKTKLSFADEEDDHEVNQQMLII